MADFVTDLVTFLLTKPYVTTDEATLTADIEGFMLSRGYDTSGYPGLLVDLESYLIANNFATVDGVDIFRDFLPDAPDNIVAVYEYAGLPGGVGVDTQLRLVQINVRNTSYSEARQKIHAIYNLFHVPEDPLIQITPTRWSICQPRQVPFQRDRDNQGRVTFTFNMGITTHKD